MKKQKTTKGLHKIEFYAALDDIRKHYFKKGFVVYKILYEKLKKEYTWSMSYNTFRTYAKREGLVLSKSKEKLLEVPQEVLGTPKKKEPIITRTENKHHYKTAKDDIPENRKLK